MHFFGTADEVDEVVDDVPEAAALCGTEAVLPLATTGALAATDPELVAAGVLEEVPDVVPLVLGQNSTEYFVLPLQVNVLVRSS